MNMTTMVVLVPGSDMVGNLESLMLSSLGTDERLRCIDALLECWQANGFVPPVRKGNFDRMRAQLWLAQFVDREGYIHLGSSMSPRKVTPMPWNLQHPVFEPLRAILKSL